MLVDVYGVVLSVGGAELHVLITFMELEVSTIHNDEIYYVPGLLDNYIPNSTQHAALTHWLAKENR